MSFTSEVKNELTRSPDVLALRSGASRRAHPHRGNAVQRQGQGYRLEVVTDMPKVARFAMASSSRDVRPSYRADHAQKRIAQDPELPYRRPVAERSRRSVARHGRSRRYGIGDGGSPRTRREAVLRCRLPKGRFPGQRVRIRSAWRFPFRDNRRNRRDGQRHRTHDAREGYNARIMQRRNAFLVYLKSGEAISGFLRLRRRAPKRVAHGGRARGEKRSQRREPPDQRRDGKSDESRRCAIGSRPDIPMQGARARTAPSIPRHFAISCACVPSRRNAQGARRTRRIPPLSKSAVALGSGESKTLK